MRTAVLTGAVAVLAICAFAAPRTFKGEIMDSQCAYNVHSNTHSHSEYGGVKGVKEKQCTIICVEQGDSQYVLLDQNHKTVYRLSTPQKDLKQYAGEDIEVAGNLDSTGKVIAVSKIMWARKNSGLIQPEK